MKRTKLWAAISVVSLSTGPVQAEFLSDLVPSSVSVGWGQLQLDQNVCANGPIRIRTIKFQKGVTAHANSAVSYDVGGAFGVFAAVIGVDDSANDLPCGGGPSPYVINARFVVELDGQQVFAQDLDDSSDPFPVCLDLSGVQTLTLRTVAFGSHGIDRRHTVWADAQVSQNIDCNGVCGDGTVDPDEQCDGTDDSLCPGQCDPDCTCPPVAPIPTVSEWGLVVMALLLLTGLKIKFGRGAAQA